MTSQSPISPLPSPALLIGTACSERSGTTPLSIFACNTILPKSCSGPVDTKNVGLKCCSEVQKECNMQFTTAYYPPEWPMKFRFMPMFEPWLKRAQIMHFALRSWKFCNSCPTGFSKTFPKNRRLDIGQKSSSMVEPRDGFFRSHQTIASLKTAETKREILPGSQETESLLESGDIQYLGWTFITAPPPFLPTFTTNVIKWTLIH